MKAFLRKIIVALIGGAILAVSAGVLVVAVAMALFGVLRPSLGGPGAAAAVALFAAVLLGVVGVMLERWILRSGSGRKLSDPKDDQDMMRRLIGLAQDRPVIATGALIGAIFLAIRNPALTALVVKAFFDQKSRSTKKA